MAEQPSDAGLRGRLVVADRVVERVATIAAAEVEGVVRSGSGLDRALGHQYPRAAATIAGDRAKVQVEIAIAWPYPLAEVSADVRRTVRSRLEGLVGLTVDAVDVTTAEIVNVPPTQGRRVE